jgi:hypothetical protein
MIRTASLVAIVLSAAAPAAGQTRTGPDLPALGKTYGIELVTRSPSFPVLLRTGTIDGEEASLAEIDSFVRVFAAEWTLYPPDLVRRTGLKKVVFCRRLAFEKQARTGIPDFENDILYLDVTRGRANDAYVRKVIHHEFFHIVDLRDDGQLYEDERWARLNPAGFRYGAGGAKAQHDPTVSITGRDEPGFVNRYAMSGVEEDKAEVFAHLMVEPRQMAARAKADAFVRAKVERMRELLAAFSPRMDDRFWDDIAKRE